MVRKLRVECPTCHTGLSIGRDGDVPFVMLDLLCSRCGSVTTIVHPKYAGKDLSRLPTCLDCGHPIPPLTDRARRILGPFIGLSRTCPKCWISHRRDEPSDNLDSYINLWYRLDIRKRLLANPPCNSKIVSSSSRKPANEKENRHASRKAGPVRVHPE